MRNVQLLDVRHDAQGHILGTLQRGLGQQHRKLLAAIASGKIAQAQRRTADGPGHPAQTIVTRHMAIPIVVGLEGIDIHQQQTEPGALG